MTTSDNISAIEAIEKALEKATPGVWDVWEEQTPNKADAIAEMAYQVENSDPFVEVVYLLNADGKCPATTGCGPTSAANAAYISACSPERMRSILAEARKAEAMEREIAEKDAEIARLRRLATDRKYMQEAYRNMLGPKGLEVATMWERKGVTRFHTDWEPAGAALTGEERAQVLLDVEEAVSVPMDFMDRGLPTVDARTLLNGGSDAQG